VLDALAEARDDEERDKLRRAAFVGWQFAAVMVGGNKVGDFGAYAKALGLDGPQRPREQAKRMGLASKDEAMQSAERTLEYFRTHRREVLGRGQQRAARAKRKAMRRERRERGR